MKDRQGKTAYVTVNVIAPKPILTDADEDGVTINGAQGKAKVRIIGGNGEYKILDSGDAKIMRLEIYGNEVTVIGRRVGTTSFTITDAKNQVLHRAAALLVEQCDFLLKENEKDMEAGRQNGMPEGLLDRLLLTEERVKQMAEILEKESECRCGACTHREKNSFQ